MGSRGLVSSYESVYFYLSLAFGVMIAYASYKHETSDIAKNAVIISVTNSCVSIIAGFAVFATLGYMSAQQNIAIETLAASGPKLAFIVFPQVLSLIPGAPIFAALFFSCLSPWE